MGLSAVYFDVHVCGMIDVSVKIYSKVKLKELICFQTHLYERDAPRIQLVPSLRRVLLHPTK